MMLIFRICSRIYFRLQLGHCQMNRPFPSSCLPALQSESKCEVFVMVISSTLHIFITKTLHVDSL